MIFVFLLRTVLRFHSFCLCSLDLNVFRIKIKSQCVWNLDYCAKSRGSGGANINSIDTSSSVIF